MKIFRISDKTMFNGDYNKYHHYLVYKTNPNKFIKGDKGWRALQLNHLYFIDNKRKERLSKGYYIKEKFKEFDVPSLVDKRIYYTTNKNILNFDKNIDYQKARRINNKQASRILKNIE